MTTRTVIVQGGGSSAGVLLLLASIVGLVALFSGNLDRIINAIAGKQGGAAGLGTAEPGTSGTSGTAPAAGVTTRTPAPSAVRQAVPA